MIYADLDGVKVDLPEDWSGETVKEYISAGYSSLWLPPFGGGGRREYLARCAWLVCVVCFSTHVNQITL